MPPKKKKKKKKKKKTSLGRGVHPWENKKRTRDEACGIGIAPRAKKNLNPDGKGKGHGGEWPRSSISTAGAKKMKINDTRGKGWGGGIIVGKDSCFGANSGFREKKIETSTERRTRKRGNLAGFRPFWGQGRRGAIKGSNKCAVA